MVLFIIISNSQLLNVHVIPTDGSHGLFNRFSVSDDAMKLTLNDESVTQRWVYEAVNTTGDDITPG